MQKIKSKIFIVPTELGGENTTDLIWNIVIFTQILWFMSSAVSLENWG